MGKSNSSIKYRVRFNLGRGDNYMKWQIKTSEGLTTHVSPSKVCLTMRNAKLINNPKAAKSIFEGARKRPIAWIECDSIKVSKLLKEPKGTPIKYNPRVQPFWRENGLKVDGKIYSELYTVGREVFYFEV